MNPTSCVKILTSTEHGIDTCASVARISRTEGNALQVFEAEHDEGQNLSLIKRVLSSGHKSIIEHHHFTLAFNDVSVLVEQFMIEFRLASFMVKSRRYVDFRSAGIYMPHALTGETSETYRQNMQDRFAEYAKLLDLDIPREDARFVLPYCFLSNFYVTVNARELIHMTISMLVGRGSQYDEIRDLGASLKAQFDEVYPGLIDAEMKHMRAYTVDPAARLPRESHVVKSSVDLIGSPADAPQLLNASMSLSGRFDEGDFASLLRDARPRELECLTYTYMLRDISLPCVTHFARHRMHSPVFPPVSRGIEGGGYVLPESIHNNAEARAIYTEAFRQNQETALNLLRAGMDDRLLGYFSLSGHVIDFMTTVNARELAVFSRLRVCRRAQWEIQEIATAMLNEVREGFPELFRLYGPSCLMDKRCPEGKLTCGRPYTSYLG